MGHYERCLTYNLKDTAYVYKNILYPYNVDTEPTV